LADGAVLNVLWVAVAVEDMSGFFGHLGFSSFGGLADCNVWRMYAEVILSSSEARLRRREVLRCSCGIPTTLFLGVVHGWSLVRLDLAPSSSLALLVTRLSRQERWQVCEIDGRQDSSLIRDGRLGFFVSAVFSLKRFVDWNLLWGYGSADIK